ncbi:hypothetical protein TUM19329_29380 [Legionella antarctica]|uniref:Stress-response A/B barrel domain-containing protein n=1 Tax=Legionella antarctica TaxID=2708020 RepID=A0A6F8T8Y7_9GAMM|nr:Dabb family protein [Legionella antarctica]BCA96577.1 hypothetical protein TUM19329_29380 [Legionella antarctica]
MIKHIVLLKFKANVTPHQINYVFHQLGHLKSLIPSINHFSFGENCSPEDLNKGFTHAFMMEFNDIEGRDTYLNHPEHIRIAQDVIVPLLENGLESALTLDYKAQTH